MPLRIIAGEFRSRSILSPGDAVRTRPIPDRVKESLFSILRGHTEGASVLDVFSGTGTIGLEALSRGASLCVFVELDREVAGLLQKNIKTLGVQSRAQVIVGDALGAGVYARCPRPVDLIFFDPPYALVNAPLGWRRVKAQLERFIPLLSDDGFAVLRTPWPFTHAQESSQEPPPGEERREKKPRRNGKDRRKGGRPELDEDGDEIIEELDVETLGDAPATPADQPPAPRTPVDLALAGAQGPETHVYRQTAVHLYVKKKPDAGAAATTP